MGDHYRSARHRGLIARLALFAMLASLLAADVYANLMGDQSYDGGGGCGGKGCIVDGTASGYRIAFLLVALMGAVVAWPAITRRFREGGESSAL